MTRLAMLSVLLCLPLQAGPIVDFALGSKLAGAVVTVTHFGGPLNSATFVADGDGAVASAPGSGGFTLTVTPGDTSLATWTLVNTDPSPIFLNVIVAVTIDLTLSGVSLFDSDSLPSTPDSGPGVAGVVYAGGVGIMSSGELVLWGDPANLGDMYRATTIVFSGGLSALASSSWMDDTDVIAAVPEPAGFALSGLGLSLLCALRRRGGVFRS